MDFWIIIGAIIAILVLIPFIRMFFKRLSLRKKITKLCQKRGYRLIPTHKCWFFGGKWGKTCDLHIETEREILSIKLFGTLRRSTLLYFCPEHEFYAVICIMQLVSPRGGSVPITFKTRQKKLPDYDYSFILPATEKKQRRLLLINPVCGEYTNYTQRELGNNTVADIGSMIWDSELYSLSPLLNHLDNER